MTQEFVIESARRVKTGSKAQLCFEFPDEDTAERFWMRAFKYEKDQGDGDRRCGSRFRVTVRKPKKPRTTGKHSLNTHFNGHIQEICQELGTDFEDTKLYIKRKALAQGYPFLRNDAGEIVYSMVDNEPLPQHERDADTKEAAILVDTAHWFAAEHMIALTEEE